MTEQHTTSTIQSRPDLSDEQCLQNLVTALIDDILTTPDSHLVQELIEDGQDPRQIADEVRGIIWQAIALHEKNRHG